MGNAERQVQVARLPGALETQLQAIFERDAEADCVAVVWREPLEPWEMTTLVGDTPVRVVYCPSELAMREALVKQENAASSERLVLLSQFDEVHLAKDVLARLWRNEPQRISPWKTLQQLIKVRYIDPRLTRQHGRWMAEALLGGFEHYRGKVVFGEVLDLENAWRVLAFAYLGYDAPVLDLGSLFRWSVAEDVTGKLENLPDEVRRNLTEWFRQGIPDFSSLVQRLLNGGHGEDLLAIGLACSVIHDKALLSSQLMGNQDVYAGRGRFTERFLGGEAAQASELEGFGCESVATARAMLESEKTRKQLFPSLDKAEQILASLDFMPAIGLSPVLPASFHRRLSDYAAALSLALKGGGIDEAKEALDSVHNHALAGMPANHEQLERAEMALRLVRWLHQVDDTSAGVNEMIAEYVRHGGFADWARSRIWSGDVHETLSQVYRLLSERVADKREQQNREFATQLDVIARGDRLSAGFVLVEQALEKLVGPIAREKPVLLLVLDGMSQAVYRRLLEDLVRHHWVEIDDGAGAERCLVSALPTITRVSRFSLLAGRLGEGVAVDEKQGFGEHPVLKKLASTRFPPTLFHKQQLRQPGSGALADAVRGKIASTEYRVLGAVINAIDDQLSSSSQVTLDWALESVGLLRQVLEAAREAGRVVILTSDHGHVLDHDSHYAASTEENGERYQLRAETIGEYEVSVSGERVVTPGHTVVLPWSERLRYTKSRSMGYHGGGSLQEVVIPWLLSRIGARRNG